VSDHPDASHPLLQRVAEDAHRYGFLGLEFANDLALAEFANRQSTVRRLKWKLRALQKAASSKGFGLIARKAAQESSVLRKLLARCDFSQPGQRRFWICASAHRIMYLRPGPHLGESPLQRSILESGAPGPRSRPKIRLSPTTFKALTQPPKSC